MIVYEYKISHFLIQSHYSNVIIQNHYWKNLIAVILNLNCILSIEKLLLDTNKNTGSITNNPLALVKTLFF